MKRGADKLCSWHSMLILDPACGWFNSTSCNGADGSAALPRQVCMPDHFGGDVKVMFGIDWTGSNGGSYSWGKDDGDETTTCLHGLWKDVSPVTRPLSSIQLAGTKVAPATARVAVVRAPGGTLQSACPDLQWPSARGTVDLTPCRGSITTATSTMRSERLSLRECCCAELSSHQNALRNPRPACVAACRGARSLGPRPLTLSLRCAQGKNYTCHGTKGPRDDGPTYSVPTGCAVAPSYPAYILGKVGCQGHNLCAKVSPPGSSQHAACRGHTRVNS